jgi:hypothetical protein
MKKVSLLVLVYLFSVTAAFATSKGSNNGHHGSNGGQGNSTPTYYNNDSNTFSPRNQVEQDQLQAQLQRQMQMQGQLQGQIAAGGAGLGIVEGSGNSEISGNDSSSSIRLNQRINAGSTFNQRRQAPAVIGTSASSSSNRGCEPVGSGQITGPIGGLGFAVPMGGSTCNGLNVSDKVTDWRAELNDAKLWLVECNTMVAASDELEEGFEKANYSCQAAYDAWVAHLKAQEVVVVKQVKSYPASDKLAKMYPNIK